MTADAVGGVWTYTLDLVRALPDLEFLVATMGPRPTHEQAAQMRALPNVVLEESDFRLEWQDDPWEDVDAAGKWLLEIEDDFLPDLVHLNGFAHGALPFQAPKLVVAHSCVLSWWEAVKGEPAPPAWDRYREAVGKGLRMADLVAAPTRTMLLETERLYGPLARTAVVPNGRGETALKPKEPFVFAAGRMWDEAKNVASLTSIQCSWPIRVAGEGSATGRLPASEVLDWMARASIYALPARYEPFGLSVLEAALAGCALVLGDIPSLRENWDGRALFVHPDDRAELQAVLSHLIDDDSLRNRLGVAARERGLELSLERFGQGYRELYGSLWHQRPAHASATRLGTSLEPVGGTPMPQVS